ncbi:condensation protein [Streptomyces sp. NPDC050528]|uniref:condensation protein n=1 Tax=Streptomyces sp. NPDC050528 TaxID=3365623 RepID=UPI0037BA48A6
MTTLNEPRSPTRIPFPTVDEIARHCHQSTEPETVHIEVHLPGPINPERLRTAFTEALHHHPRILMREAPGPWYRRRYEWELTTTPDIEPVTFPPPTRDALKQARTRSLDHTPPLTASPPIRLEAVTHPHGTALILTVNHTALDGPACLRILATAAELYGGKDNTPTAPPTRPPDTPDLPENTPSTWTPPARVAPGTPTLAPTPGGNGLLLTELPVPHRPRNSPYTVNDQLMVTTALMIAHWNREHGEHPRPMRITMPVDDRPRGTDMPIGNGTRLVEVTFAPDELTTAPDHHMAELLHRTATRTRALKALPRPQLGHGATLLTTPVVPVAWRATLTRSLRKAAAPWTSTTLLSNIGRIPYTLDFGDPAGRAHAVWFSAPARMPRGLTVTTASTAGKLHVALRWSRTLLGPADGAHLRDLFEHYLHTTEQTEEHPV